MLTREELMRHEAAGITTRLPQTHPPRRCGLPGHLSARARRRPRWRHRDGAPVCAQPSERRALRVAGARHAQRQDSGSAQKPAPAPRSRFVPLPESAMRLPPSCLRLSCLAKGAHRCRAASWCARKPAWMWQARRHQTRHAQPALLHELSGGGRAWPPVGQGRNLGALKAELGAQARGAFQALAQLKLAASAEPKNEPKSASAQLNTKGMHGY
jgi:ATP-dependent helicase HrpA